MNEKYFKKKEEHAIADLSEKRKLYDQFYYEQLEKYLSIYNVNEKEIIGHTNPKQMRDDFFHFTLEPDEYIFTTYKNKSFGKAAAIRKEDCLTIQYISFKYSTFIECNFSNIVFDNCNFVGCKFIMCTTTGRGVKFKDCTFSNVEFTSNQKDNNNFQTVSAIFENCKSLMMEFDHCNATDMILINCNIVSTKISNSNLQYSIFQTCDFHAVHIDGCNFKGVKIIKPRYVEIEFKDKQEHTEFNDRTFLSVVDHDIKDTEKMRKIIKLYKSFARQFKAVDLMDHFGEYFFLSKKTSLLIEKTFLRKLGNLIGLITCGYGERPFYCLYTSLTILITSALCYMSFGIRVGTIDGTHHIIQGFNGSLSQILENFGTCLHFSIVTFTTVGYGNIVPIGDSVKVSSIEMILGVIMVAVWTSTLVRKMTR
ncbi:MAG: pentapeptide repeat-containing protein [Clostridiaceae bacterium]